MTWYCLKSLTQTYKVEVTIKPLLVGLKSCSLGDRTSERKHLNARKVEYNKNISSLTGGSCFTSILAGVAPVSCTAHTLVLSPFSLLTLLHIYYDCLIIMFHFLSDFPNFPFYSAVFSNDCCFLQTLFSCSHAITFKVLSSAIIPVTFVQFNIILYAKSSFIFRHLLHNFFYLHNLSFLMFFCPASRYIRAIKTNLMHCLSPVYFVNQPLHVSGIFVAHHQEVYCIYTATGKCCLLVGLANRQSTKKHNKYQFCIYTVNLLTMGQKYARDM